MFKAYDLHGTITSAPEEFKRHMESDLVAGHKVVILSGSPIIQLADELSVLDFRAGFHYSGLISVTDDLISKGYKRVSVDKNGRPCFDEYIWWSSKALICAEREINVLIDNERRYQAFFIPPHKTKFILYTPDK